MDFKRKTNAIRNTRWGILQKIVNTLFPFLVRTILIYKLSAEYAGLSELFVSVLSVLSLTELGFSNAIVYSMYKPIAENDTKKICALLNLYRRAYWGIGTVIFISGLVILPFIPYFIKDGIPADANLYVLFLIYLINNVISYFLYGYKTSLLSAHQREDINSRNKLIYNLILYGVQCISLLVFKDYYIYALLIPLATILLNVLNNNAVNRMFPDYKPEGVLNSEEKEELKKNIVGIMIWKIGGATRNAFDSIALSMYLGLVVVAIYNNYLYVVNGMTAFLSVILTSIIAGIGNKIVVESPERNYEDFRQFNFFYMWISGWCAVCMMCLFQPFMRIWMGKELVFPNHIMFLFCYYFMMLKQGDIGSVYYQAAGLWWEGKLRSVVEVFLNLVLNFILGYYLGAAGIIIATIISWTFGYFYGSQFIFTKYFKNGRLKYYFFDNLLYMLVTGIVGVCTFAVYGGLMRGCANDIPELLAGVAISIVLPNIMFVLIYGLSRRYRMYIRQAVNLVKARK